MTDLTDISCPRCKRSDMHYTLVTCWPCFRTIKNYPTTRVFEAWAEAREVRIAADREAGNI